MNRLANESSPYLQQHAHNPVDWYPWGEEALERAKKENKPILVSIGYATCHWCHVMERESFEDKEIADYMNEHFINIKIDREERPDLDHLYMMAVQILTGSGGWPLNCFLTPDGRPFYGGTYYPPMPSYNRPSWLQLLIHLKKTFEEKREVVESQANRITESIRNGNKRFFDDNLALEGTTPAFSEDDLVAIFERLQVDFDKEHGGFGAAPKFPGTISLDFLLAFHYYFPDKGALEHVLFSLKKMVNGGIYDQLGGGFARYATDSAWLIPHFEKMLYDNALLVSLLSETYKVVGSPWLEAAIRQTLEFTAREMTSPEGGFYAALDADSEGEEGKYYVWSMEEIEQVLDMDAPLFCAAYGVSEGGNWEGKNILTQVQSVEKLAAERGLSVAQVDIILTHCRQQLLEKRTERVRPGRDEKILLGWNALMATAYARAFQALGEEAYRYAGLRNLDFLWDKFRAGSSVLLHSYKDGKAKGLTFLDDYAFFIEALLEGYSISLRTDLLEKAAALTEEVIQKFGDPGGVHFFFSSSDQEDILLRKKEVFDSATPSGNAVMAGNLQKMGILLDKPAYTDRAIRLLATMKDSVRQFPSSFSRYARQMVQVVHLPVEVAVVGPEAKSLITGINRKYFPSMLLMGTVGDEEQAPLLRGKTSLADGSTGIYVCKDYACQAPVATIEEFEKLIQEYGVH